MTEPVDLLAENGGIVEASFFPGVAQALVLARLETYLTKGRAAAVQASAPDIEGAATAWANYQVCLAVYLRLSSQASSVSLNDAGSRAFTSAQIQAFKDLADDYLHVYTGLIVPGLVLPPKPATYAVLSSLRGPAL